MARFDVGGLRLELSVAAVPAGGDYPGPGEVPKADPAVLRGEVDGYAVQFVRVGPEGGYRVISRYGPVYRARAEAQRAAEALAPQLEGLACDVAGHRAPDVAA